MKKLTFILLFFYLNNLCNGIILQDKQIQEIYREYVEKYLTKENEQRYVPFPLHKNNKKWKWDWKDFPRVIAVLEFERFINENKIYINKGLAFNGIDPEWENVNAKQIIQIDYAANPQKYDLHNLILEDNDFDFVMVNQTLEHVYDPITCLKNIYKYMKKGGILYFNVPINTIPHSTPFHYYTGFTPTGLGILVKLAGFQVMSIGQWGNLEYLILMNQMLAWPDYKYSKNPGLNNFNYPLIGWIFAKK